MPDGNRSDIVDTTAPIPPVTGEMETPIPPKMKRGDRRKIADTVLADIKHALDNRTNWLGKRQEDIKRLEMEKGKSDPGFPWDNSSDIRLPSVRVAVGATRARFLSSIFSPEQATEVSAVGSDDLENVPIAHQFIEWMLTDDRIGFYEKIDEICEPVIALGDYVIHPHWVRETRFMQEKVKVYSNPQTGEIITNQVTGEPIGYGDTETLRILNLPSTLPTVELDVSGEKVVHEGATLDVFDTEDLILPPDAKDIKTADWVAQRVWMSVDQIARKRKDGSYNVLSSQEFNQIRKDDDKTSLDTMAGDEESAGNRTKSVLEGTDTEIGRNKREVFNWFGKWDINNDGLDEEVICTVHGKTGILMRVALLDDVYPHGKRPFILVTHDKRAGRPYGRGLSRTLAALDDAMNTAINQFFDRGTLINALFGFYKPGEGMPDEDIDISPGKFIPSDDPKNITIASAPDYSNIFINFLSFIESYVERLTGVSDATVGRMAPGRRTATEVDTTMGEGSMGFGMKSQQFQHSVGEAITQMFQLYQAFIPDGFEIKINPTIYNSMISEQKDLTEYAQLKQQQEMQQQQQMMQLQQLPPQIQQQMAGQLTQQAQQLPPFPKMQQPLFRLNREDIRGQYQLRLIGDPVSGNKQMRQRRSLLLIQTIAPVLAQFAPDRVVVLIRNFLRDFNVRNADEILGDDVVKRLEAQQEIAAQSSQMQNELAMAEAQLEQAKGQAEIQQIQAIIRDIISRIQSRQVEMRRLAAEAQKHISQSKLFDMNANTSQVNTMMSMAGQVNDMRIADEAQRDAELMPQQDAGLMPQTVMEESGITGETTANTGAEIGPESEMG